jgi:RNA polymerase sigma-70 factor, ECF subfamily
MASITLPAALGDLEEVFREHQRRMLLAAYRVTGSAEDAEDVLQTVFLRLLDHAPIAITTDQGSYLERAAVNAALDLVRSRRRATVIPFEETARPLAPKGPERPERSLTDAELRAWLRSRLAELSPLAAEIFVLRCLEGFGNQEIAAMLGTTHNSVGVILHRTRSRLREELRSYLGETDDDEPHDQS